MTIATSKAVKVARAVRLAMPRPHFAAPVRVSPAADHTSNETVLVVGIPGLVLGFFRYTSCFLQNGRLSLFRGRSVLIRTECHDAPIPFEEERHSVCMGISASQLCHLISGGTRAHNDFPYLKAKLTLIFRPIHKLALASSASPPSQKKS